MRLKLHRLLHKSPLSPAWFYNIGYVRSSNYVPLSLRIPQIDFRVDLWPKRALGAKKMQLIVEKKWT